MKSRLLWLFIHLSLCNETQHEPGVRLNKFSLNLSEINVEEIFRIQTRNENFGKMR